MASYTRRNFLGGTLFAALMKADLNSIYQKIRNNQKQIGVGIAVILLLVISMSYFFVVMDSDEETDSSIDIEITGYDSSPNCDGYSHSGDGDVDDPYQIENVHDLQCISSGYYELADDIDASGTEEWRNNFEPISTFDDHVDFKGLDGNGYTITDLHIDSNILNHGCDGTEADSVQKWTDTNDLASSGMFDCLSDVTIENITFNSTSQNAETKYAGLLSGYVENSDLSDVTVEDSSLEHDGNEDSIAIGGLIGMAFNTHVDNIVIDDTTVEGEDNYYAGGIVGYLNDDSIITNSEYVNSVVEAEGTFNPSGIELYSWNIGGIAGSVSEDGTIENSYSSGTLVSRDDSNLNTDIEHDRPPVGGIAGLSDGVVYASDSSMDIVTKAESNDGTIVGHNNGTVDSVYYHGGTKSLVGYNAGTIMDSYTTQSSDITGYDGNGDYQNVYTLNINELDTPNGVTATKVDSESSTGDGAKDEMIFLDFENTWETTSELPTLQFKNE